MAAPPTPGTPTEGQIGVDQWVARAGERRSGRSGVSGLVGQAWERLPPPGRLALLAPAAIFPFVVGQGDLYSYGLFTLIYILLGLGLNIVVGFAGLLDLGYIAFFGFGAYAYSFLSSTHTEKGHHYATHWPAEVSIPVVVVASAVLGLLVGLPSRRLLGDYLAIVTLFFGQAFVVFVNAADPYGITNGTNGLGNVDPMKFFGFELTSSRDYFYSLLGAVVLVLVVLYCVSESRTGRAWRASREDPLAAELMGMPVNRLKLMAFVFGAAIAGFAGCFFAAIGTGAFASSFQIQLLVIIYAVVILGGTGSLAGMVIGAIVINGSYQVLASTSPPNLGRCLFYGTIVAGLLLTVRPWQRLAGALAGTLAFGLALHSIVASVWPAGTKGAVTSGGFLTSAIKHWSLLPQSPGRLVDVAYVGLIGAVLLVIQLKGWWRTLALVPTLYLTVFVWENLLIQQPAVTRFILFGALLIGVMSVRPQGLLGTAKVEIV
jgi:ABC-type branched-subunit amino acid transport system permease subunit